MDKQKLSELGGHPGVSQLVMGTAGTQIQVFLARNPASFSPQLDTACLVAALLCGCTGHGLQINLAAEKPSTHRHGEKERSRLAHGANAGACRQEDAPAAPGPLPLRAPQRLGAGSENALLPAPLSRAKLSPVL